MADRFHVGNVICDVLCGWAAYGEQVLPFRSFLYVPGKRDGVGATSISGVRSGVDALVTQ